MKEYEKHIAGIIMVCPNCHSKIYGGEDIYVHTTKIGNSMEFDIPICHNCYSQVIE